MGVRVKICGLTNLKDALAAAEAGADALGFVFADSPRRVEPDVVRDVIRRLPPFVVTVGVFVDETPKVVRELRDYCGLDAVQLHGDETEDDVAAIGGRAIKAIRIGDGRIVPATAFANATLLLDTYVPGTAGGTGKPFDWSLAVEPARQRPIVLAGGLTPENITRAIQIARPYAVDVSSGVEIEPGRKDHGKIAAFIRQARTVQPA
jgi:phosphoribosylanthranilate isomerase